MRVLCCVHIIHILSEDFLYRCQARLVVHTVLTSLNHVQGLPKKIFISTSRHEFQQLQGQQYSPTWWSSVFVSNQSNRFIPIISFLLASLRYNKYIVPDLERAVPSKVSPEYRLHHIALIDYPSLCIKKEPPNRKKYFFLKEKILIDFDFDQHHNKQLFDLIH